MSKDIWVFLEVEREEITKVSLEALTLGRKMADDNGGALTALLERGSPAWFTAAGEYGADRVYLCAADCPAQYDIDGLLNWMEDLFISNPPAVMLLGVSPLSRELAPRLAARFKFALITECVDLKLQKGQLIGQRQVLNGKAQATVSCSVRSTQVATLRAGFLEAKKSVKTRTPEIASTAASGDRRPKVEYLEYIKGDPAAINLSEAEVIVAVGKGLQDIRNLKMVEELALLLGASLGGTRVAVDLKYISSERQIGMTGKNVSPRLFISCGISGQYPHTVSMDSSETIIVINKDKDAPMFKLASLGIVGNLEEVVPALISRIKQNPHHQEAAR